ncbi:hypothetical protein B0H10DRAFT_2192794 [Mycena sp. CBHHK59/15]|nr:hypothetical protein B0H10DRAFT_2192794 [Mycena sp. CBHHK59/15]
MKQHIRALTRMARPSQTMIPVNPSSVQALSLSFEGIWPSVLRWPGNEVNESAGKAGCVGAERGGELCQAAFAEAKEGPRPWCGSIRAQEVVVNAIEGDGLGKRLPFGKYLSESDLEENCLLRSSSRRV